MTGTRTGNILRKIGKHGVGVGNLVQSSDT